jgi:hypothetical protein
MINVREYLYDVIVYLYNEQMKIQKTKEKLIFAKEKDNYYDLFVYF